MVCLSHSYSPSLSLTLFSDLCLFISLSLPPPLFSRLSPFLSMQDRKAATCSSTTSLRSLEMESWCRCSCHSVMSSPPKCLWIGRQTKVNALVGKNEQNQTIIGYLFLIIIILFFPNHPFFALQSILPSHPHAFPTPKPLDTSPFKKMNKRADRFSAGVLLLIRKSGYFGYFVFLFQALQTAEIWELSGPFYLSITTVLFVTFCIIQKWVFQSHAPDYSFLSAKNKKKGCMPRT